MNSQKCLSDLYNVGCDLLKSISENNWEKVKLLNNVRQEKACELEKLIQSADAFSYQTALVQEIVQQNAVIDSEITKKKNVLVEEIKSQKVRAQACKGYHQHQVSSLSD